MMKILRVKNAFDFFLKNMLNENAIKSLEDVLKDPNQTFGWQANSDVLLLNNVDEVSGPKDKLSV